MVMPTSDIIAKLSGVSRGTVYRALNDRPGIKRATKEKILKIAEELGYRPNFIAQSLVNQKTKTIGVVIFDLNNRIFAQMISAIESHARKLGYCVYLTLTHKDPQLEMDYLKYLVDRRVDGIILLSVNKGRMFDSFLSKLNIPLVTFANKISSSWPYVGINDRQAIKDAVEFLYHKQYRRIVYLAPVLKNKDKTLNKYSPEQRIKGFHEALLQYDDMDSVLYTDFPTSQLLDYIKDKKTAILCPSDIYALQVLKFLKENKVNVPKDVGVMGFDNIDTLEYVSPTLATVAYSIEEIGKYSVNRLMDQINEQKVPKVTLVKHTIIPGESV